MPTIDTSVSGSNCNWSVTYPYQGTHTPSTCWSTSSGTITVSDSSCLEQKLRNKVDSLEIMVKHLHSDLIIRRLPGRRLKGLRAEWIKRFISRSGLVISSESPLIITSETFGSTIVLSDDEDRELLLANRAELISLLGLILGKQPTCVITEIEKTASPLERLAQAGEDE